MAKKKKKTLDILLIIVCGLTVLALITLFFNSVNYYQPLLAEGSYIKWSCLGFNLITGFDKVIIYTKTAFSDNPATSVGEVKQVVIMLVSLILLVLGGISSGATALLKKTPKLVVNCVSAVLLVVAGVLMLLSTKQFVKVHEINEDMLKFYSFGVSRVFYAVFSISAGVLTGLRSLIK